MCTDIMATLARYVDILEYTQHFAACRPLSVLNNVENRLRSEVRGSVAIRVCSEYAGAWRFHWHKTISIRRVEPKLARDNCKAEKSEKGSANLAVARVPGLCELLVYGSASGSAKDAATASTYDPNNLRRTRQADFDLWHPC